MTGRWVTLLGLLVGAPVFAQEAPTQTTVPNNDLGQVVVQADSKAAALESTGIDTTLDAKDIARFADTNVGGVLRRQPGVIVEGYSSTSANRVRLKGLGSGYVRVLVDGVPSNTPLDEIAASEVERIIISSSGTAASPGGAIAGVINIVLKKPARKPETKLEGWLSDVYGKTSAGASLSLKRSHAGVDWNVNADASRFAGRDDYASAIDAQVDGVPVLSRSVVQSNLDTGQTIRLAGGASWQVGEGRTARLAARHSQTRYSSTGQDVSHYALGQDPGHSQDTYTSRGRVEANSLEASLVSATREGRESTLSANFTSRRSNAASDVRFVDVADTRQTRDRSRDAQLILQARGTRVFEAANTLTYGVYFSTNQTHLRREDTWALQTQDLDGRRSVLAAFATRAGESGTLAWEYGLRYELLNDTFTGLKARRSVLLPSLQLRKKLSDHLSAKLALTSGYKAPTPQELFAPRVVAINNSVFEPDAVANPGLATERSLGIEGALVFERKGVSFTSTPFYKRISKPIISVRENRDGRWEDGPRNFPSATVRGVDTALKLTRELPHYTASLSVSAGWYASRVAGVNRAHDRLGSQPGFTGGIAVNYQSKQAPLGAGLSFKAVRNGWVAVSGNYSTWMADQRLAELYLSYQDKGGGWWKLVGGNLLEPVESSQAVYQAGGLRLTRRTQHPSHRELRLSYERKW